MDAYTVKVGFPKILVVNLPCSWITLILRNCILSFCTFSIMDDLLTWNEFK